MVASQNGWRANDRSTVSRRLVPGSQVELTVRNGATGDLLLEVARCFDQLVQDIDNARGALDDWGYAERPIRGGAELSNHASGTAIDLNATRWPLGASPSVNLSPEQIRTVRQILAATGGVVRWGGDYSGRKDPMHFEINDGRTEGDCAAALARLRAAYPSQEDTVSITADQIRVIVREEIAAAKLARQVDVGFARDQVLTELGVAKPEPAPSKGGTGSKLDRLLCGGPGAAVKA